MGKKPSKSFVLECWLLRYRFIVYRDNQFFGRLSAVKEIGGRASKNRRRTSIAISTMGLPFLVSFVFFVVSSVSVYA